MKDNDIHGYDDKFISMLIKTAEKAGCEIDSRPLNQTQMQYTANISNTSHMVSYVYQASLINKKTGEAMFKLHYVSSNDLGIGAIEDFDTGIINNIFQGNVDTGNVLQDDLARFLKKNMRECIELAEGQKVLDVDGNTYLIEKGDLVESIENDFMSAIFSKGNVKSAVAIFYNERTKMYLASEPYTEEVLQMFIEDTLQHAQGKIVLFKVMSEKDFDKLHTRVQDIPNLGLSLIEKELKEIQDYQIYHNSYTSAIDEVLSFLRSNKLYLSADDVWNEISVGSSKPKNGSTNRFNILCYDVNGFPAKQSIAFQVTDLGNNYELNMYLNKVKIKDYIQDSVEIFESTMIEATNSLKEVDLRLEISSFMDLKKLILNKPFTVIRSVWFGGASRHTLHYSEMYSLTKFRPDQLEIVDSEGNIMIFYKRGFGPIYSLDSSRELPSFEIQYI